MKVLRLLSLLFFVVGLPAAASAVDPPDRRPSPTLASLPSPAAGGGLRILLVDDDVSDNNNIPGDRRLSSSDRIFRQLVSEAVGGNAAAWAFETVKPNAKGPDLEQLRKFSLILWYTGASYGGSPDNSAALSIEDEKTVRRYLEEVGGVVLLVSPGYAERAFSYDSTWEKSNSKFLSDVMGVRGGVGLAQRFEPGTVTTPDGKQFTVGKGPDPESQFSVVNPDGATVLFTSLVKSHYSTGAPMPVATVSSYGRGRLIYVGFTFENLVEQDRTPAFTYLLSSTGLMAKPGRTATPLPVPGKQAIGAPDAGPATVQVSGTPTSALVSWTLPTVTILNASPGAIAPNVRRKQPAQAPAPVPTVTVERLVPNAAPVRLTVASPDALTAHDPGPLTPGLAVTYRVTLTDARGLTGSKDATFTPSLPRDPASLSASVLADGSIILSWPEVPGVTSYQITSSYGLNGPVVVRNATEWRSPRLNASMRKWTVNSVYEPGGNLTARDRWPSVTTQGSTNVGLPTPRVPFLSKNNGAGSHAESQAHYRTRCTDALLPGSLCTAAGFILTSGANWEAAWLFANGWLAGVKPEWPIAEFKNNFDLGVERRVNCTPRRNGSTVCWATSYSSSRIPKSLSLIIMEDDKAFFGSWEWPGGELPDEDASPIRNGERWTGAADIEFNYAKHALLSTGSELDSQGRKGVPHACLSCHGGTYNPVTNQVVGASLLPVVPGRLQLSSNLRGSQEEPIRRINQIILQSNPAPAIVDQINAMYKGAPNTPGTAAGDAAVPTGWSQQPGLYKQVIEPYCSSCHFAQRGPMNFRSWGNLLQNKDAVQRTVCTEFTMPHSEILFRRFWTEGGAVSLPGMLSTSLGFSTCRQ